MKFDKSRMKEEYNADFVEGDVDIMDNEHITGVKEDEFEPEMAEIELVLSEPTKLTDVDGSVVLATPGDVVTIKSESLKRIKSKVE